MTLSVKNGLNRSSPPPVRVPTHDHQRIHDAVLHDVPPGPERLRRVRVTQDLLAQIPRQGRHLATLGQQPVTEKSQLVAKPSSETKEASHTNPGRPRLARSQEWFVIISVTHGRRCRKEERRTLMLAIFQKTKKPGSLLVFIYLFPKKSQ